MGCPLIVLIIGLLLGLGLVFPRYGEAEDHQMYQHYQARMSEIKNNNSLPFPVMTFNMRLDMLEEDPNNHFTKRINRIDELFSKWKPYIVGLQEPFGGQLLHLQSVIPKHYKEIGYNRNSYDLGHRSRHNDFNVAILYDSNMLELLNNDFLWLSETPRVPDTKSWDSVAIRSLNMARFKIKSTGQEVVAMNTHLDRWGEKARREQATIVKKTIREWKAKYPQAIFMLFGDFNTAPGQGAHDVLTTEMNDAWEWCSSHSSCLSNSISSTFHGWQGSLINTYLARVVQYFVFVVHGMGVAPPVDGQTWKDVANDFVFKSFPLLEALPTFPRMHVDWILFDGPAEFEPNMISVVDVRSGNYSSDHFPIVSLFEIKK